MTARRNTRSGGKNAKKQNATPDRGVASLRLGRYPFAVGIPYFMEKKKGVWRGRTTPSTRKRDLELMAETMERLKAQGDVFTTDPRHMEESDVRAYADEIKRLDPDTQALRLRLLNDYLCSFRNRRMDDLIEAGELLIPSAGPKPIRTINPEDLVKIFESVKDIEGWHGSVGKGMVSIYFGTGFRPSELRLAEYRDLDLKKERLFVSSPKGEGNWATKVWVDFIRPDVMPMVREYDHERKDYLEDNGVENARYLFPNLHWHTGYYSEASFRRIKTKISEASGVDFSLKMFRATLTTLTVNGDLSRLPAMGMQLRQSNSETIKKFYADIQRGNVGKQLKPAWQETPILRRAETNLNEIRRNDLDAFAHRPPAIDFDNTSSGWEELAHTEGFEPPTCSLGGCCHIQSRPRVHRCRVWKGDRKGLLKEFTPCPEGSPRERSLRTLRERPQRPARP